ncbi:hypothetical protein DPMN_154390 [Dreissena polymorpha]|uniref:Uncharacterized protein n=1 Tax=Dreissena polymorpha TaxID=45954 RepID=A0A9D4J925_DREPO|nr:hypothetical protein DPMN_154390 [Dreissena polymorpha]
MLGSVFETGVTVLDSKLNYLCLSKPSIRKFNKFESGVESKFEPEFNDEFVLWSLRKPDVLLHLHKRVVLAPQADPG